MTGPAADLARLARDHGSPIVDDRGATFVWLGPEPAPIVVGGWCWWRPERGLRMQRAGDAWATRLELPGDAYVEYQFVRDGSWVRDPLNPNRTGNGFGGWNQRLWMPRAPRRAAALRARRVPHGRVERGEIDLGWYATPPRKRRLDLYRPALAAGVDPAGLPLLVVLDGPDYLRRGRLHRLLDALIADGTMAPVAAAFLANAGPARASEYAANDFTAGVLANQVVPEVERRLGLRRQRRDAPPGRAAILGSSFGGLMALHAATRRPDVFGTVIAQSTSGFVEGIDLTTLALLRLAPPSPIRLWLDAGDQESIAEPNDALAAMLRGRGFDVTYRRQPGGHDQTSWAESLIDALPAMFPPD